MPCCSSPYHLPPPFCPSCKIGSVVLLAKSTCSSTSLTSTPALWEDQVTRDQVIKMLNRDGNMPRHRWQWSQEKAGRICGSRSKIWTTDLQVVRTTELEEYYCDPPLFVAGLPYLPSQAQIRFITSAPLTSARDQNTFLAQTTHIKQICFQKRDTRKVPNILLG